MLIYLDESYDKQQQQWMILGALFNLHSPYLHKRMNEIRATNPFTDSSGNIIEEKYNNCYKEENYYAACKLIDMFFESTSWFRAVAVDLNICDINKFGALEEPLKIKEARRYKKFTELLIRHNTENIYYGTLLVDKMHRCYGDKFIEIMKEEFINNQARPTLNHISEVSSESEQYQVIRLCDILTGCILNDLVTPSNPWKTEIRLYLCKKLGVRSLKRRSWRYYSKNYVEKNWPKYNIWFWKPLK